MQTSTLIFNVAAVLMLLGAFIALLDLMKHKTKAYGVTTSVPTITPTSDPALTPVPSTLAPM